MRFYETWTTGPTGDAAEWDARASTFSGPVAGKNDSYVSLIYEKAKPSRESTDILDIGCGTGRFSLAFAKDSRRILGLDLSPVMVDIANGRPETSEHPDARFVAADWSRYDVGGIGRFNLSIAHMTPAVGSAKDLEKMLSVSDGWCFLSAHVSSGDKEWNELSRMVGKPRPVESNKILNAMDMLLDKGLYPEISYSKSRGMRTMPAEHAEKVYTGLAEKAGMPPDKVTEVLEIVRSMTKDGLFVMDSAPVSAMLFWNMQK